MQELAGAVDRVDQDEGAAATWLFAPRRGLFGNNGNARQPHGEPGQNDGLRSFVGVADRAAIRLLPRVMVAGIDMHDGHRRLDGQFGKDLRDLVAIDRIQDGLCRSIPAHGNTRERRVAAFGRSHLVHSTQHGSNLRLLERGCKMGTVLPQSICRGVSPKTRPRSIFTSSPRYVYRKT